MRWGAVPPSIFFGSKTGLQESCSPPHFLSALPVAAFHPFSCADTTAREATPLSQVSEMSCGEPKGDGKEMGEMGLVKDEGTAETSLAAEQNGCGVVPQWSTHDKEVI